LISTNILNDTQAARFVAVWKWMVLRQLYDENCRLVHEVFVELLISEAGSGRVKGRVGEIEVLDRHLARRSSNGDREAEKHDIPLSCSP
jgi:hypothetical protein